MASENTSASQSEVIDLTNCEREQVHLLGGVQDYGCLIATTSDFMISHVSENVDRTLGLDADAVLGRPLVDCLPSQTVHDLRSKLQIINSGGGETARLFGYPVMEDERVFDVSIHMSGQVYVFEFEPKTDFEDRDEMALVQPLIADVNRCDGPMAACGEAAIALQVLSGFDRVMVYKFNDDLSGEVVSECKRPDMEPFLGLRYPASDIPPQARALYKRSTLRLIANVDGEVSPISPRHDINGNPMDLSLAVTRAVSPIHLEYLRNMGVSASMSVSIIQNGELWGLFACHHNSLRYVDYQRRSAIELFAKFFSYELADKIQSEARIADTNTRRLHDNLMIKLSGGSDLVDGFKVIANELSGLVASDGFAIYSNGRYVAQGVAPSKEIFVKLVRFLNTAPTGEVFATSKLAQVFPDAADDIEDVAGLMAVPISRTPRDYIVFFRREIARSVKWAGNPEKPVELGPNGKRLTPRKSFEAWYEMVRQTSENWSPSERRVAESLRVSLIEIVLKLTQEANATRRAATDKQDLLIAELNHRVRNILNLIQGVVAESKTGATDISSYTRVLEGRIRALSRAHDQLTKQEWSATSLRQLIQVEVDAYLNGEKDRLVISGDAPMLEPEAFSSLALVIHELVTNSAKYGALTDRSGSVRINLEIASDGSLLMTWRERGGPPVKAPTRRGFGSTIIEKTIPFEFSGTVDIRFQLSGLEVDIMIPSKFISVQQEKIDEEIVVLPSVKKADARPTLSGQFLIVEDNLIIAIAASKAIEHAGADKVLLASNVEDALGILKDRPVKLALLDVNLGSQTSLPVAEWLHQNEIPFILATGYGDSEAITKNYPSAEVLNKPYTSEVLVAAIARAISSGDHH